MAGLDPQVAQGRYLDREVSKFPLGWSGSHPRREITFSGPWKVHRLSPGERVRQALQERELHVDSKEGWRWEQAGGALSRAPGPGVGRALPRSGPCRPHIELRFGVLARPWVRQGRAKERPQQLPGPGVWVSSRTWRRPPFPPGRAAGVQLCSFIPPNSTVPWCCAPCW